MGLLDLCQKYFNTTNLYDVLGITETATDKEVKKAYYKLSLKVHPDRVGNDEKLEATEKFKVLAAIHALLSDKDKRAVYDETKTVEDDDNDDEQKDWSVYWKMLFKEVTVDAIKAFEKEYIGSEEEKEDLKRAYLNGKGDMDFIVDNVQFARTEHEPRLRDILNEMIKEGEIPSYKIFTHEPDKKRKRRIAKEKREEKEVESNKDLNPGGSSLEDMIKQRQVARMQKMDSVIDSIAAKYANVKPKGVKRKATAKEEPKAKSRRRK